MGDGVISDAEWAEAVARQFARNLTKARRSADISQEELGSRASLHRTTIGLLERGESVPHIDTLMRLSQALDISPEVLLEGILRLDVPNDFRFDGERDG